MKDKVKITTIKGEQCTYYSLRMEIGFLKKLKKMAKDDQRTIQSMIMRLLTEALQARGL